VNKNKIYMKIGCIISMYDEIKPVKKNIQFLKTQSSSIVVVQSQPTHDYELLEPTSVDHYELLSDVGGSKENYQKAQKESDNYTPGRIGTIPATALTRNFSNAFRAASNFDADWWVVILGDCVLSNFDGIKKIIKKLENEKKFVGITRGVGLLFPDDVGQYYSRVQWNDTTDLFPQFFIVHDSLIKNGFFHNMELTNKWCTEICLGDNIIKYCNHNSLQYWDIVYSICDYPAPKWIEGFDYNKDRTALPGFLLGLMNLYRRIRMKLFYKKFLNAENVTRLSTSKNL
jgi:hypothetical protein